MFFTTKSLARKITTQVTRIRWPARGRNKLLSRIRHIQRPNDNKVEIIEENIIRLAMSGCTNRPFYRIVLSERLADRESEIEQLGTFDPMPNMFNEKLCSLNLEKIKYHLAMGCHMSRGARRLLGLSGLLPLDPTLVFFAQKLRRRRMIEDKIKERDGDKAKIAEESDVG